ncbi:mechanosensitive ion channel [Picosynechococcus sp. PCC 11901]|uniref:mechanosensitive ion channel n=1 Tax=Picosynechococcus sp. PCC 11901 TaxID=2579791 RepID=UPI00143E0E0C|nr:mechanosensitive ion channel [Picosynechococcus sp. PCC 11901]
MSPLINTLGPPVGDPYAVLALQLPESLQTLVGEDVANIIKAIAILIIGWIVALVVKAIVKGLLNKTDVDNKIAAWITGHDGKSDLPIEIWAANIVYWFVILFTVVAVLETLQLDGVYTPLNELLSQVTNFLPQLFAAGLWLGVAWLVATIAKLIVVKGLNTFRLDERLNPADTDAETEATEAETAPQSQTTNISETIGNALYWFIFFFFLTPILETLGLENTLAPLRDVVDEVLLILPDLFAAALIGVVGWFIAQVVRRLVTNLLKATGVDQIGEKFGLSSSAGRQSLSWVLGTIAYILILIPVAISALEVAQIEAISLPAIAMLDQVLMLLPKILAAAIILTFAYVVGEYVSEFVSNVLTGFGFDNVLTWLGLDGMVSAAPREGEGETAKPGKTPSQVMGTISLVVIMLVAALTAVDVLQIEALTSVVGVILAIAGQVLVALLIFALGLYFSNISYKALAASGSRQSKILGQAARIIILVLVGAMALEQMGIATNIVNLAFGLLVGGIAVAIAIAFGLGGKDIAAEQVRNWLDSMKND